ncbi:MAG: hypothetical protein FWC68_04910 [Oscillospiraceae bacterium]|nr:hypothetical protein [Oscillospiraceae bacterium]
MKKLKNSRGITMISLIVYIASLLIALAILATVSAYFTNNFRQMRGYSTDVAEFDNFNVFFLEEVKRMGNAVEHWSVSRVEFATGNVFEFRDNAIYLVNESDNREIRIAEGINQATFNLRREESRPVVIEVRMTIGREQRDVNYVMAGTTRSVISREEDYITGDAIIPVDQAFSRANGVVEIVWLNLDNTVREEPLSPNTNPNWLAGMTPVMHNGTVWVDTSINDPNWYNYEAQVGAMDGRTSRWANASDNDDNMFVWIPRYAYRIVYFDTLANANARRVNPNHTGGLLGFSTRQGMIAVNPQNNSRRLIEGTVPINVVGYVQTTEFNDYIPHPAFTFGEQMPGMWVGKYTTGFVGAAPGNTGLPNRVVIQEGITMWRIITASNMFSVSRGFADPNTNGITGTSIMMRNTDWGVVAYLAHSRFGRNGEQVALNDGNFLTGAGGNLASTTGNETGIFDMRGGAWEIVAAYVNTVQAQMSDQITNIRNAGARYKHVYVVGDPDNTANNYLTNRNVVRKCSV